MKFKKVKKSAWNEANWSVKYENKWGETVSEIENIILNTTKPEIPSFSKDYLMKFLLLWTERLSVKQTV